MSDLSRLLDDVYNSAAATAEPSWTSDSALEDAFADWVPGSPVDAAAIEHSRFEDHDHDHDHETGARVIEHLLDDDEVDELRTLLDQAASLTPLLDAVDAVDDGPEVAAESSEPGLLLVPATETEDEDEDDPGASPIAGSPGRDESLVPSLIDADFVAPVPVRAWSRHDDDILPRGRRRRLTLSRR
jgi:hypothetical protein